ncbi:MAG TPA: tetratricopeptide repeat protein [Candidatus Polarisedimenticolia bacterium]|nr:tetratricopeptide repeat protein [Candidatus Polarisedimenticolia bacterium]
MAGKPSPILTRLLLVLLAMGAGRLASAQQPWSDEPLPSLDKESSYQRALEYLLRFTREDFSQASRLFNRLIKSDPKDPRGYSGQAQVRAVRYLWGWDPNLGNLEKGVSLARRGVELDPESQEARLGLGVALMASQRYRPALAEMDRSVSLDEKSFRAHLFRGMILRGLRRTAEARREAARAIELMPSSPVAHALLGDCEQDQRRFTQARANYLVAAELDQTLLWPRLGVAAAYQREGKLAAAEKAYLFAEEEFPKDATRIRIQAASMLVAGERYEDALSVYENLSEKESPSPPLLRRLMQAGRAYSLEKLDRKEEAEYFWNQLVTEFPSDFDGAYRDREIVSQGYEALSKIYESKGESRRSMEMLKKACAAPGMPYDLYAGLAERQREGGLLGDAVATLRRGLAGTPDGLDTVTATQRALPILRSAAGPKGTSRIRASALDLLEDLEAQVARVPAASHTPYLNLARAAALLGQDSQAVAHLREAVEKGFVGLGRAAKDPDFQSLSRDPAFRQMLKTQ